jgi:predicted secreted protein
MRNFVEICLYLQKNGIRSLSVIQGLKIMSKNEARAENGMIAMRWSATSLWCIASVTLVILAILGQIVFCHGTAFSEEVMKKENLVILTKQDQGKEIEVKVGDVIQIELEAMGTAGYQWFVEGLDQEMLKLISEETKALHPGRLGAPVLMVWKFEVIKEGTTEIRMDHYRTWEGKEQSTDHFEVKIKVGG